MKHLCLESHQNHFCQEEWDCNLEVVALIGAFDFKQMRVPLGCLETIHNFEALCLEAIFFLKHDVLKQFFLKHFGLCAGQSNINF